MLDVFRRVHAVKMGLPTSSNPPSSSTPPPRVGGYETRSADGLVGVDKLTGGGLFDWAKRKKVIGDEDAILEVARELAEEGRVLCFDEFQVSERGDTCNERFTQKLIVKCKCIRSPILLLL